MPGIGDLNGLCLLKSIMLRWPVKSSRHMPAFLRLLTSSNICRFPWTNSHEIQAFKCAEHIQIASQIIVSCSLLGGRDHFFVPYGQQLVHLLQQLIGNLTEKGMHMLIPVMNVVLQIIPEEGPALLEPAIKSLLSDVLSGKEPTTVVAGTPTSGNLIVKTAKIYLWLEMLHCCNSWFLHNYRLLALLYAGIELPHNLLTCWF